MESLVKSLDSPIPDLRAPPTPFERSAMQGIDLHLDRQLALLEV